MATVLLPPGYQWLPYSDLGLLNLGVNGLGFTGLTSAIPNTGILVTDFQVSRATEGPQVIVSWTSPTDDADLSELRLLRRTGQYPDDENDGYLVYSAASVPSTPATVTISDGPPATTGASSLAGPRVYYYRMFSKSVDGFWLYDTTTSAHLLVAPSGYFVDKLYQLLPALYRTYDTNTAFNAAANPLQLTKDTDPATGEIYNFNAPTDAQGELARFLKIFGLQVDEIKALLDFIPELANINETSPEALAFLANLVGWNVNKVLNIQAQRTEVAGAITLWRNKLTASQFQTFIENVSAHKVYTVSREPTVLRADTFGRTFIDLGTASGSPASYQNDVDAVLRQFHRLLPGDLTHKFLATSKVGVASYQVLTFLNPKTHGLTANQANKVLFSLPDVTPVGVEFDFTVMQPMAGKVPVGSPPDVETTISISPPQEIGYHAIGYGDPIWDYTGLPVAQTTMVFEIARKPPDYVLDVRRWTGTITLGGGALLADAALADISPVPNFQNLVMEVFYAGIALPPNLILSFNDANGLFTLAIPYALSNLIGATYRIYEPVASDDPNRTHQLVKTVFDEDFAGGEVREQALFDSTGTVQLAYEPHMVVGKNSAVTLVSLWAVTGATVTGA